MKNPQRIPEDFTLKFQAKDVDRFELDAFEALQKIRQRQAIDGMFFDVQNPWIAMACDLWRNFNREF